MDHARHEALMKKVDTLSMDETHLSISTTICSKTVSCSELTAETTARALPKLQFDEQSVHADDEEFDE